MIQKAVKTLLLSLAAVVALGTATSTPVLGQADIVREYQGSVDPDTKYYNRGPLDFIPFEIVDPNTGEPVPPETLIDLPEGQMRAGDYADFVNAWERFLNLKGYSLRDDNDTYLAMDSSPDPEFLQAQVDFMDEQTRKLRESGDEVRAVDNTVYAERHWDYTQGNGSFNAFVRGQLILQAVPEKVVVSGNARAGATILGASVTLASADARASMEKHGTTAGSWSAKLYGNFLGLTLVDLNKSGTIAFAEGDEYKKTIDVSAGTTILVGFIPVTAKVGMRGDIGLGWDVTLVPITATAEVKPFAHASAYAEAFAGFSLDFLPGWLRDIITGFFKTDIRIGAGVRANLNILTYEGTLHGMLDFSFEKDSGGNVKFFVDQDFYYRHYLNLLSGSVKLFADLRVKLFGASIIDKHWEWNLFSWPGYTRNEEIFHFSRRSYLN